MICCTRVSQVSQLLSSGLAPSSLQQLLKSALTGREQPMLHPRGSSSLWNLQDWQLHFDPSHKL